MKIHLLAVLIVSFAVFAPSISFAAIDVDFETTPLFGTSNFLPGDTVVKTVTVTNTGTETQQVYTELLNVVDGGLASKVAVAITSGGSLFSGSFNDFDAAGKVFLTSLDAGDAIVYSYALSFESAAGNPFQNKSLGFDLCIGFSGGQFECDDDNQGYSQGSYGGGYSQGSYGSGYSQGSYGGSSSSGQDGGNGGNTGPTPRVLGEQTSNLPFGAPNTGFGGLFSTPENATRTTLLFSIVAVIVALVLIRKRLEVK